MFSPPALALVAILAVVPFVGCTSRFSGDTVEASAAGQTNRVLPGTVLSQRPVTIRGEEGGIGGAAVGAAAGGIAGSTIGTSRVEGALGAIGGAVLGGLAGAVAGERLQNERGIEYIVRLESGQTITLVQGVEPRLEDGQRVMVVYGGRRNRLIPDTAPAPVPATTPSS